MRLPFKKVNQVGEEQISVRFMRRTFPLLRVVYGLIAVVFIGLVAGGIGSVYIPPWTVLNIITEKIPGINMVGDWPASWETIVWQLRIPRIVLVALVGAGLGISGATYQGLFRNPLADPYLIGVASGAGLGATVALLTPVPLFVGNFSVLPLAAFAGGILAVSIAYTIARRSGGLHLTTLILAGVAIAALAGAVTSLLIIRANPDVRPLLGWLFGGFIGASWKDVITILPYVVLGSGIMMIYGRILNLLQVEEQEAKQMGVNVEHTKLLLISIASLTTAAVVSVSGLIGFVGLIAPHAVRLIWGYDYRALLPMSMLVGAGFLILADIVARTIVNPAELPVGVVTAFCGAPFFLFLLRRSTR